MSVVRNIAQYGGYSIDPTTGDIFLPAIENGGNLTDIELNTDKLQQLQFDSSDRLRVDAAIAESAQDSFARLRVSNVVNLFESALFMWDHPETWDTITAGGGSATYLPNESSISLSVGTASGDKVVRSTREYFRYQPGRSQTIVMTGYLGPQKVGLRSRLGYFDDRNGLFFQMDESGVSVVRRSYATGTPVETVVPQANWSEDTLDGNGPSGITVDFTKAQIFIIDYQWLGVGQVRYALSLEGKTVYFHREYNSNVRQSVYITSANLPVRYEIENLATTASPSTMKQICCAVQSEGGALTFDQRGHLNSYYIEAQNIGNNFQPVLSLRLALTANGQPNRASLVPVSVSLDPDNAIVFAIYKNPVLTGASWVSAGPESFVEVDTSANTISNGTLKYSGFIGQKGDVAGLGGIFSREIFTLNSQGTQSDIFTLAAKLTKTGNSQMGAAVTWNEVY